MKTIGLIGGLSWESSAEYYRIINQTVRDRLGGLASAQSLMYSVNFAEIEQYQHAGEWDRATAVIQDAAQRLERGGADFLVICSNTMHRMAEDVAASVGIPLLHIADPTAEQIQAHRFSRVGLLGTAFTMEQRFYTSRLREKFGLEVIVPDKADRTIVHRVIYDELVQGQVKQESKAEYIRIMKALADQGAQCLVLGCTEIMLLVEGQDSPVPVFDTTTLHAKAAAHRALDFPA